MHISFKGGVRGRIKELEIELKSITCIINCRLDYLPKTNPQENIEGHDFKFPNSNRF